MEFEGLPEKGGMNGRIPQISRLGGGEGGEIEAPSRKRQFKRPA